MSQLFNKYKQWLLIGTIGGVAAVSYLFLLKGETQSSFAKISILVYLWIFFSICTWFLWSKFIRARLVGNSKLWNGLWLSGCLLAGLWLADNIPLVYPTISGDASAVPRLQKIIFLGSSGIIIGLVIFAVISLAAWKKPSSSYLPSGNEDASTGPVPVGEEDQAAARSIPVAEGKRKWRWFLYAAPMLLSWLVYLLAYWPGMMSADSLDQWGQVLSGHFVDHHPAFHTFIIWLLTRIYLSPAVVAIAQIIALALVAGAILAYFDSLGVSRKLLWIASGIFAIIPVNGTMVNTLWKDILYSTALVGFTFLVLKIAASRGSWISLKWRWLILGVAAAMVMLIRYNGPPIILGVFLLLFVFFYKQWQPLLFSGIVAAGLFFGIRGPVFQLVQVAPSNGLVVSTTSLYTIAANSNPGSPTASILSEMSPLNTSWDCSIFTNLLTAYRSNPPPKIATFSQKTANLVSRIPAIMTYYYRCRRSIIWIVWDPHGVMYDTAHVIVPDDPNPYGIVPDSKIPRLQNIITEFIRRTASNTSINWLIWRPALYLYAFLFIIAIQAARTRNLLIFLAAAPVLIQSIESTVIMINPNFRYYYASYLLALLFWPLFFYRWRKPSNQPDSRASSG